MTMRVRRVAVLWMLACENEIHVISHRYRRIDAGHACSGDV
jgi:hypothetical protein